jgi:hypothetical protein
MSEMSDFTGDGAVNGYAPIIGQYDLAAFRFDWIVHWNDATNGEVKAFVISGSDMIVLA